MKLFHLFLLLAFAGVTLGEPSDCMKKGIIVCALLLQVRHPELVTNTTPCAKPRATVDCLYSESDKCKDKRSEAIKKYAQHTLELCNANAELNIEVLKYSNCLQNPAYSQKYFDNCVSEHTGQIVEAKHLDLHNIQELPNKFIKSMCPLWEKLTNCGYDQMKSECGDEAENAYRKIGGPGDRLRKEACDSASIPRISITLIFLQFLFAILFETKF